MSQQGKVLKQRYYWIINNLSFCRPVLLTGNFQAEQVAAGEMVQKRYYRNFKNLGLCRPELFQVTSNLNMSQQGKVFKQRYYRNLNTLSTCRPVLLSSNVQSENVAAGESVRTTILSER